MDRGIFLLIDHFRGVIELSVDANTFLYRKTKYLSKNTIVNQYIEKNTFYKEGVSNASQLSYQFIYNNNTCI